MARYQLNATKKEDIYWYVGADKKKKYAYRYNYYDYNGKRREKSKYKFDTILAAERALIAIKSTVLNGGEKIVLNDNMTIAQWVEIYFERKKSKWKGTTPKTYRNIIDSYIQPFIGHHKLSRLTKSIYQSEFIDKLIPISASKSIITYHNFFVGCMNAAVEDEIIDKNRIVKAELPRVEKQNTDEVEGNYLTPSELAYLLRCVKESCDITRHTLISILAATGMRRGEAGALRWSEIDFKNKLINISRTRDVHGERSAKTLNSIRTIDMTDDLAKQLEQYRKWCIERKLAYGIQHTVDDLVFISKTCNPLNQNAAALTLLRMHELHDTKLISPHGLRHTFATISISSGTPPTTIAKILGMTTSTLLKTYAHSFSEREKQAMQVMSQFFNFDKSL
ncbi:tyrosine-type recombinase/integrase [Lysinibacillus pakistanensis]|uniref:tyrosine-type recombinase/integrase n=1 Tax=Lysinibacillus pakistanensis TaxID=759811 RepID=UPI003D29860B